MKRRDQRGFTLMELMVVIVIVAILAAVAVPLYINYVRDARRTEARGAIAAIISAEQVFFQNTGAYTADTLDINMGEIVDEVDRNWSFTLSNASATGFTVAATGRAATDAAGLSVQCVYDRVTGPAWTDQ